LIEAIRKPYATLFHIRPSTLVNLPAQAPAPSGPQNELIELWNLRRVTAATLSKSSPRPLRLAFVN